MENYSLNSLAGYIEESKKSKEKYMFMKQLPFGILKRETPNPNASILERKTL